MQVGGDALARDSAVKILGAGKFASILPKAGDQVTFDDAIVNERLGRWTDLFNANVAK